MENFGIEATDIIDGEGIGLGKDTLGAVVGVGTIAVLEVHRMAARQTDGVDAQGLYLRHLTAMALTDAS